MFINAEVIEPFGTSNHNVVKAAFIYHTPVQSSYLCNKSTTKTYYWKLGDCVSTLQYLRAYNWDFLFSTNLTVDSMWCGFRHVLDSAIDMFVPFKYVTNKPSAKYKRKYPRNIRAMAQRK